MRALAALAIAITFGTVAAAPVPKVKERRPDAERLLGTWEAVCPAKQGGMWGVATWTIDDKLELRIAYPEECGRFTTWAIKLDPQATPKAIDVGGFKGIYEFDGERLSYVSSTESRIVTLQPGLYVVSNHVLDTPWPKVERLKQGLRAQLAECNLDEAVLFALLADQETPPDAHLPDTGVGLEWERRLASIFVRAPGYGTRASTLLRLQRHRAELVERSFDADGNSAGERRFHFPLQPAPQA